tara:strand:+ start:591 stop:896 length:306 start_codon:yes stop_codon:yes gene_type:complete
MINRKDITMRPVIRTRYHSSTNSTDQRISVTWKKHTEYVAYADNLDMKENHAQAAQGFLNLMRHCGRYDDYFFELVPDGFCFDGDYFWTWNIVKVDQEEAA